MIDVCHLCHWVIKATLKEEEKRHKKCCHLWDYLRHEMGRQTGGIVLSCNIWEKNAVAYTVLWEPVRSLGEGLEGALKATRGLRAPRMPVGSLLKPGAVDPMFQTRDTVLTESWRKNPEVRGTKTQETSVFSQVGTLSQTCTFCKATGSWHLKKNSWDFPGIPVVKTNAFS